MEAREPPRSGNTVKQIEVRLESPHPSFEAAVETLGVKIEDFVLDEEVGDGEEALPASGDDAGVEKLGGGGEKLRDRGHVEKVYDEMLDRDGGGEGASLGDDCGIVLDEAYVKDVGNDGSENLGGGDAAEKLEGDDVLGRVGDDVNVDKLLKEKVGVLGGKEGDGTDLLVGLVSFQEGENAWCRENAWRSDDNDAKKLEDAKLRELLEDKHVGGGKGEDNTIGGNAAFVLGETSCKEGDKGGRYVDLHMSEENLGSGPNVNLKKSGDATVLDRVETDVNVGKFSEKKNEGGDGGMVRKDGTYIEAGSLPFEEAQKAQQSPNLSPGRNAGCMAGDDHMKLEVEDTLDKSEDAKLQKFVFKRLVVGTSPEYVGKDVDNTDLEKDDGEYQQTSEHMELNNIANPEKLEEKFETGGGRAFQAGDHRENTEWMECSIKHGKQSDPSREYMKEEGLKSPTIPNDDSTSNKDATIRDSEVNSEGKWSERDGGCDYKEYQCYAIFEKDSPPFNEQENSRQSAYPLRPSEPDCSYYMRTGKCGYGSNCRFNHPLDTRHYQAESWDMLNSSQAFDKVNKTHQERDGQMECKFLLFPGGCKHGNACKYDHHGYTKKVETGPVELNFSDLPLRPGQKECPYYIRTGTCKYSTNCRFNHPDPTAVSVHDPLSTYEDGVFRQPSASGEVQFSNMSTTLQKSSNDLSVSNGSQFRFPAMLFPPQRLHQDSDCDDYPAPINPVCSLEGDIPHFSASVLNDLNLKGNNLIHTQTQLQHYPERPEQSNCPFFIRHGNCKFGSTCKFSHPQALALNRFVRETDDTMHQHPQMLEYPERPGHPECQYFMKYGDCKFKSACKFHHPSHLAANYLKTYGDGKHAQVSEYPQRPGEYECSHFIRNGWCKFKSACKFHHPSASALKHPTHTDALVYQKAQMEEHHRQKLSKPENPFLMKQGDCKFGSASELHHPRTPLPKVPLCFSRTISLPLRPDQPICTFYSRFGICKFGPSCKFDHPMHIGSPATAAAKNV